MKDMYSIGRRISLIVLIVLASLLILSMTVWHNTVWAIVFGCLTGVVLVAELYCYVRFKKTISTIYGEFLVAHRIKGYTGLALFWLAMTALVFHLGFYGKTEEEKTNG